MTIPPEAFGLIGAIVGAVITLIATVITQRGQLVLEEKKIGEARIQLAFKERSEKVHLLATDLSALAYAFIWITWSAQHDDLDQKLLQKYWDQVLTLMPRLYGDYVLVAGMDDELGRLAASFVERADSLDVSIGKATLSLSKTNVERLGKLHDEAEAFADSIAKDLVRTLKGKRLV